MSAPIVIPLAFEPGRYLVRSRSRPGLRLLVDLTEKPPFCGCEATEFRAGEQPCWHIRQAQQYRTKTAQDNLRATKDSRRQLPARPGQS